MPKKIILYPVVIMGVFALALSACGKRPSPDDKVLARVSNKPITLSEFKSRIEKMPPYYKNMVEKNKKRYLDEVILETLLYEEALYKKVDRDKDVQEVIDEARKKILVAKFIKNEVEDKIRVAEEECKSYYEAHKEDFKTPELWRASHILVPDEKEAKDIVNELSKGANFEDLARAHSKDVTSARGGDIGYFRMGQLVPEFEKACEKLNIGETSDIVRTQFGYHIIKLTDKKIPAVEDYQKVKPAIEGELKKKKRSELFDNMVSSLKQKYNVKIEEDVFKTLDGSDKENKPPETK